MILVCPNCDTRFIVDPRAIGSDGRRVRCGNCAHMWFQPGPELPDDMDGADTAPTPGTGADRTEAETASQAEAARRLPPPLPPPTEIKPIPPGSNLPVPFKPHGRRTGAVAAVIVGLTIGAGLAGALLARDLIVGQLPAAANVFNAVGWATDNPLLGLDIRDVQSEQRPFGNGRNLIVVGEVVNRSDQARIVPPLRAELFDSSGRSLRTWSIQPSPSQIQPGQTARFRSETWSDPREIAAGASRVTVTFAQ